jgi:hypothetical protein
MCKAIHQGYRVGLPQLNAADNRCNKILVGFIQYPELIVVYQVPQILVLHMSKVNQWVSSSSKAVLIVDTTTLIKVRLMSHTLISV